MVNINKLTETQKQNYIDEGGGKCPYCGSDDITAGDTDYGDGAQSTEISCNTCDRKWWDVYALVGIEEE